MIDGWHQQPVNAEGVKWQLRVRPADAFSAVIVDRIELWFPTEDGVLPLVLARNLSVPLGLALPPWGETVDGARLRIAMPRATWKRNEQLRLYYQAESTQSGERILRAEPRGERRCCEVLIDGNALGRPAAGLSTGIVYHFPFQGITRLPYDLSLSPGRHTLTFTATGDAGTYTNLRGEKLTQFDGTLVSNTVDFEIAE